LWVAGWLADGPVWGRFCVFGEIWSLLKPVLPALVCMGPISPLSCLSSCGLFAFGPEPLLRGCVLLLDWVSCSE